MARLPETVPAKARPCGISTIRSAPERRSDPDREILPGADGIF
jgi:hypothetical protein